MASVSTLQCLDELRLVEVADVVAEILQGGVQRVGSGACAPTGIEVTVPVQRGAISNDRCPKTVSVLMATGTGRRPGCRDRR